MNKKFLIGLSSFIVGIFMIGIGCGVAFAEYSTFDYGGVRYPEGSKERKLEKTFTIEDGKSYQADVSFATNSYTIVEDASVKKDEIKCRVKYRSEHEKDMDDIVMTTENEHDDDITPEESLPMLTFYMLYDYNNHSDFEIIMKAKDLFLQDIKDHKLYEYHFYDEIESVELLVNPDANFEIEMW